MKVLHIPNLTCLTLYVINVCVHFCIILFLKMIRNIPFCSFVVNLKVAVLNFVFFSQHATLLLDAALEKCEWQLCRDILRFLRSIGPGDVEPSRTPPPVPNPNYYPLSPKEARFQVGASGGQRSRSMSQTSGKGAEKSDHASLKR